MTLDEKQDKSGILQLSCEDTSNIKKCKYEYEVVQFQCENVTK